jgi:hypothetical protein
LGSQSVLAVSGRRPWARGGCTYVVAEDGKRYESRLAKLAIDEAQRPKIDPDFDEATEGEEVERKEKLKTKWAQLEAVVGAQKRLEIVAQDIVAHFAQRCAALDGKAMVHDGLTAPLHPGAARYYAERGWL